VSEVVQFRIDRRSIRRRVRGDNKRSDEVGTSLFWPLMAPDLPRRMCSRYSRLRLAPSDSIYAITDGYRNCCRYVNTLRRTARLLNYTSMLSRGRLSSLIGLQFFQHCSFDIFALADSSRLGASLHSLDGRGQELIGHSLLARWFTAPPGGAPASLDWFDWFPHPWLFHVHVIRLTARRVMRLYRQHEIRQASVHTYG
jgi:hypothetical protein